MERAIKKNYTNQKNIFLISLLSLNNHLGNAQTVNIGGAILLSNNLNLTTLRDDDVMAQGNTKAEWEKANNQGLPVWYFFNITHLMIANAASYITVMQ